MVSKYTETSFLIDTTNISSVDLDKLDNEIIIFLRQKRIFGIKNGHYSIDTEESESFIRGMNIEIAHLSIDEIKKINLDSPLKD